MTPSRVARRKPRAPKRVCAATATLSSARSRCGRRDFRRLGAVDHPRDAEAIGAHAEALRPESLLQGHAHAAVLRERAEDALGLIRLLHGRHHVEALGSLVAIAGGVAAEQILAADLEPCVDDLVAHFRRGLLARRGLPESHRKHDLAAERSRVEIEGFAAVALEVQVRSGLSCHAGISVVGAGFHFFAARCSRWRASCALSSGVRFALKSSASNTRRISISSLLFLKGERRIHSTASSSDLTCQSQKPAISSLVSVKGPSVTVLLPPPNLTRTPLELACRPSPESITPAFSSSSLNLPISVRISRLGSTPDSDSRVAFTITITRMIQLLVRIWGGDIRFTESTTFGTVQNRQPRRDIFIAASRQEVHERPACPACRACPAPTAVAAALHQRRGRERKFAAARGRGGARLGE